MPEMFAWKNRPFLLQPLSASFITSAIFFVLVFTLFRPGYGTADDINIISLASGYLGGKSLPFLVYSNVLLGFILNWFYGVAPNINWEVWLFIALNFISVLTLVYIFFSHLPDARLKFFAVISVLLSDAYFLINITYTMIAAFSALAGFCLVLWAIQFPRADKRGMLVFGIALTLAASLIRLKAMLIVFVLILPALVFLYFNSSQRKKLIFVLVLLGTLVASGYIFDKMYLQLFPDWNSYHVYDSVRSQIHDTPRNVNVKIKPPNADMNPIISEVGWSKNDLKVFLNNWFFPDKQVYSFENLQYIVEHIPGKQITKLRAIVILSSSLFRPVVLPYILIILSTWLIVWLYRLAKKAIFPLLTLLISFGGLAFYMAWAMKIPDRILMILLAGIAIFGLYILTLASSEPEDGNLVFYGHQNHRNPIWWFVIAIFMIAAFGLVLNQSLAMTKVYISRQEAYQNGVRDLENLRDSGKISRNALVISPIGFPFEWANPLTLNFPDIHILDLGWLTFSPAYESVLREFDIQSVPEALYEKENVYLMAPSGSLPAILVFIEEHHILKVDASVIYRMPGTDIELYKLGKKK
jgi:hypothetical protein